MKEVTLGLGGGSMIQIANRTLTQMMSYLIDTPEGGVVMIDGGNCCPEDAQNLYAELEKRGKCVDFWLITHAHSDHLGALLWLMENLPEFDIEIKKLCFSFPTQEWLDKKEEAAMNKRFAEEVKRHHIPVTTPRAGDRFSCRGVEIEIVSVPEEYERYPNINSTSMISVVHFPKRDVLFLGDFDVHGQAEFLRKHDAATIRKDIVQMAHHGQDGVDKAFYELIQPKICLYAAPQWLWENNYYRCTNPESAGKGSHKTLETRQWMEELNVENSYTQADGDILFA